MRGRALPSSGPSAKSDDFIRRRMPTSIISSIGIPAVFSFSISYHIRVINMLNTNNVPMFACVFIHEAMPRLGVVGPRPRTCTGPGLHWVQIHTRCRIWSRWPPACAGDSETLGAPSGRRRTSSIMARCRITTKTNLIERMLSMRL
jgi:hypothetical protein